MSTPINFVPGKGKDQRASYLVGTEKIPAAVVTRLLNNTKGTSGAKADRVFYQSLEKYPKVLDAIDLYELSPTSALDLFRRLHDENQAPAPTSGTRASKMQKAAEVFSKGICKRFKGTPEEMVSEFLEVVSNPEFKVEAVDVIAAYEKNYGKTATGFVKTSKRKGNPKAQAALKATREQKSLKKK